MIPHVMVVDDEENVLESFMPGMVTELATTIESNPALREIFFPGLPAKKAARLNIEVTTHGYSSEKILNQKVVRPVHLRLHLVCDKGGSFRNTQKLLREHFIGVLVSDMQFSESSMGARAGRYLIEDVQRRNPEIFGILYSAYERPTDFPVDRFIRKGDRKLQTDKVLLAKVIEGLEVYLKQPRVSLLRQQLRQRGLVYQSPQFGTTLRRLYDYAELYFGMEPAADAVRRRPRPTLLLDGETGTGKTELAHLVHQLSDRRREPFQAAKASALSNENMLRSTLFGHKRGAFTDAREDRDGLVAAARGGFLLLDDLHMISDACAVILHSFLDDGNYSRLGEDEVRRQSTVAVVSTVETPMWEEIVSEKKLSESFVNRVQQLVVRVDPLRARPEDIVHQTQDYCAQQSAQLGMEMELSEEAIGFLVDHGLPGGNSRKLRDVVKGLVTTYARVTNYIDLPEIEEYALEHGFIRGGSSFGMAARPVQAEPVTAQPAAPPVPPRATASTPPPTAAPVPEPVSLPPLPPAPAPPGDLLPRSEHRETTAAGLSDAEFEAGLRAGWGLRITTLAARALEQDAGLSQADAEALTRRLFCRELPQLWHAFLAVTRLEAAADTVAPAEPLDIKLFDELLRYYAIFQSGNPAAAAKELGMKDNALREFIHARERKRG